MKTEDRQLIIDTISKIQSMIEDDSMIVNLYEKRILSLCDPVLSFWFVKNAEGTDIKNMKRL